MQTDEIKQADNLFTYAVDEHGSLRRKCSESVVETLASYGLSKSEIARAFGMSHSALRETYGAAYDKGLTNLKISLRRRQIEKAMAGDTPMLIWLGKAILQQTDKIEVKNIDFSKLTDEELEQIMSALEGTEEEGGDDE